jgi:hypothetical protein
VREAVLWEREETDVRSVSCGRRVERVEAREAPIEPG